MYPSPPPQLLCRKCSEWYFTLKAGLSLVVIWNRLSIAHAINESVKEEVDGDEALTLKSLLGVLLMCRVGKATLAE